MPSMKSIITIQFISSFLRLFFFVVFYILFIYLSFYFIANSYSIHPVTSVVVHLQRYNKIKRCVRKCSNERERERMNRLSWRACHLLQKEKLVVFSWSSMAGKCVKIFQQNSYGIYICINGDYHTNTFGEWYMAFGEAQRWKCAFHPSIRGKWCFFFLAFSGRYGFYAYVFVYLCWFSPVFPRFCCFFFSCFVYFLANLSQTSSIGFGSINEKPTEMKNHSNQVHQSFRYFVWHFIWLSADSVVCSFCRWRRRLYFLVFLFYYYYKLIPTFKQHPKTGE